VQGARARIELEFDSEEEAEILYRALEPEVHGVPSKEASSDWVRKGKRLSLRIEADSGPSFRAALMGSLLWIRVAKEALDRSEAGK
jgi:KEOPS complex subunit Pcc1